MDIAKLERVSLREVWKDEARDFTVWLENNIDVLSEALSIRLSVIKREGRAGDFSVDVLAEDGSGNPVIIENQIEKTDHDHLGKVLTYLTNLEAKTAIWISSDPRPEHVRAIAWLNESTPADVAFYLVRVEAYRIGASAPAPLFSVIAEPSEQTKEFGQEKKEIAKRHYERLEFWKQLLDKAKGRTTLHAGRGPTIDNWVSASAGRPGLSFNYVILLHDARVELYIDRGATRPTSENEEIFDRLADRREQIERLFGGALIWERLEERRACRVSANLGIGGLRDREQWHAIQDSLIDAMIRLNDATKEPVKELTI